MGTLGPVGSTTSTTGTAPAHIESPQDVLRGLDTIIGAAAPHTGFTRDGDAAAVLDTAGDYIAFGRHATSALDARMQRMQQGIDAGSATAQDREQLALVGALRDRIAESVQRIQDILAGRDGNETEGTGEGDAAQPAPGDPRARRRRAHELELERQQWDLRSQLDITRTRSVDATLRGYAS